MRIQKSVDFKLNVKFIAKLPNEWNKKANSYFFKVKWIFDWLICFQTIKKFDIKSIKEMKRNFIFQNKKKILKNKMFKKYLKLFLIILIASLNGVKNECNELLVFSK